nr:f-box/lrr-repeat protein [Quercus suber]
MQNGAQVSYISDLQLQMSGPKWEDLNMDCLVNVLTRVGIESLLLGAPFVCQSCRGNANVVWLPDDCTEEALRYIADECPALKGLSLSGNLCYSYFPVIPKLISKWKNLEQLRLGSLSNMEKVFEEINCHCKNFYWLCASGANIERDTASAIVTFLPNIKYLYMRNANIDRESLEMILQGCKELVLLDARDCVGYECDDQLLKLASHISNFQHEGSSLFGDEDEWEEHISLDSFDGILSE